MTQKKRLRVGSENLLMLVSCLVGTKDMSWQGGAGEDVMKVTAIEMKDEIV